MAKKHLPPDNLSDIDDLDTPFLVPSSVTTHDNGDGWRKWVMTFQGTPPGKQCHCVSSVKNYIIYFAVYTAELPKSAVLPISWMWGVLAHYFKVAG